MADVCTNNCIDRIFWSPFGDLWINSIERLAIVYEYSLGENAFAYNIRRLGLKVSRSDLALARQFAFRMRGETMAKCKADGVICYSTKWWDLTDDEVLYIPSMVCRRAEAVLWLRHGIQPQHLCIFEPLLRDDEFIS